MSSLQSRSFLARTVPPAAVPSRPGVAQIGDTGVVAAVTWLETFNGVDGASVGPDLDWTLDPMGGGPSSQMAHLLSGQLALDAATNNDYQAIAMNELPLNAPNWWTELTFGNTTVPGGDAGSINIRLGVDPGVFTGGNEDIANVHIQLSASAMDVSVFDYYDTSVLSSGSYAVPSPGDVLRFETDQMTGAFVAVNGTPIASGFGLSQPLWLGPGYGVFIDFAYAGSSPHAQGILSIDALAYGSAAFS